MTHQFKSPTWPEPLAIECSRKGTHVYVVTAPVEGVMLMDVPPGFPEVEGYYEIVGEEDGVYLLSAEAEKHPPQNQHPKAAVDG